MSERQPGIPRAVYALVSSNVLFASGLFFHAFLYNFYLDRLGLPASVMGSAAAALTAGGLAALLPAGRIVDRVGGRGGLLVAALVSAIGLGAGAFTERPWAIYAAAAVAGAGSALWRVTQAPTLIRLAPVSQRSRIFSLNVAVVIGAGSVGMAVAGATPGWLERAFGLEPLEALRAGLAIGAIGTLASMLLYASLDLAAPRAEDSTHSSPIPGPGRAVARHGRVLAAIALVGLWMLGPALVAPFFNVYFAKQLGMSVERVGLVFGLASAFWALGVLGAGEAATRWGLPRMLGTWLCLFGFSLIALPAAGTGLALVLFFLQGLAQPAANPIIDQVLMERSAESRRGSVSSWRNVAADLSAMAGAAGGGRLLESTSFPVLFSTAAGFGILATIPLLWAMARLHRGSVPAPADSLLPLR